MFTAVAEPSQRSLAIMKYLAGVEMADLHLVWLTKSGLAVTFTDGLAATIPHQVLHNRMRAKVVRVWLGPKQRLRAQLSDGKATIPATTVRLMADKIFAEAFEWRRRSTRCDLGLAVRATRVAANIAVDELARASALWVRDIELIEAGALAPMHILLALERPLRQTVEGLAQLQQRLSGKRPILVVIDCGSKVSLPDAPAKVS